MCSYLALRTNSSVSGSVLVTIIPRFIFAGSSAQLEIPMKATRSFTGMTYSAMKNGNQANILALVHKSCSEITLTSMHLASFPVEGGVWPGYEASMHPEHYLVRA